MMRRGLWLGLLAAAGWAALTPSVAAAAPRAFEQRFSTNDTGDIVFAGNTQLTCSAAEGQCLAARAGTATGSALNNNAYVMQHVNTDPAQAPVPVFNSSTADLVLPAGAIVLRAILYFGADSTAGALGAPPPDPGARGTVLLKVPGGSYAPRTATQLDFTTTEGSDFQGLVDVTGEVAAAGAGTYSLANLQAGTGRDRQAGWSLVVAYRDTTQPPRNLTIFDGFQVVNAGNPNVSMPVSGFQTPPSGPVRTRVGFVGYEGDAGSTGDSVKLNTTNVSDAVNPPSNVFNSSIATEGVRFALKNPNHVNQLGYDSDLVRADGILANGATSAVIRLTTGGETYFPGVVTFATELFAPQLELTKSVVDVNGGQVEPGDELRYTLTAANVGGDDATNVVITDPIPTHTTFVPGSLEIDTAPNPPESSFDAQNNQVSFNVGTAASPAKGGTLPAPSTAVVAFSVTVDEPPDAIPPGTQIANAGRAGYFAETLGAPLTLESNEVVTTVAAPDLTITKTPSPFVAVGGATQDFTLTVTNSGTAPTDGSQVTVTDTPPALTFASVVSATGTGWTCTPGPVTITCTRDAPSTLPAGASYEPITISLEVVGAPPLGNLDNTASVAGGGDGDATNNAGTAVGEATTRADLEILKTAEPTTALTGTQVTFTLRVRNGGPSLASDVEVTDTVLPTDYAVDSVTPSQGTCTSTPSVQCVLGDMDAGDEATIAIVATVTATAAGATTADNTASVTSATLEPVPGNNTSTAVVAVPPTADLSITKAPSPDPLDATLPASYTLTAHNDGPQTAVDPVITDPLPPEFTPTLPLPAGCAHTPADNTVVCDLPDIPNGGDAAVTITGTLAPSAAGTILANSAVVNASTGDPDPTDNGTTSSAIVIPAADLELTKLADDRAPEPGGTVTFTLALTNHGPSIANAAQVVDTLPGGLTFVSASPACTAAGQAVTCGAGALAPGASTSFEIVARVATGAAGSDLTNVAAATSSVPDPIPANNSDATTVTAGTIAPPPPPAARADLVLTKRALDPARVGRPLRYEIRVENRGPSAAAGVTITDPLPGQVAFGSATATQGSCSGTGTVVCALGGIPAGGSATVTLTVTPRRTGSIANSATVTSSTPDPDAGSNVAAATVRSRFARTRVRVTKRADRRSVRAAGAVDYRIVVRNTGDAGARDLRVCDRLGTGLALVAAKGARMRDGQACWTISRLARGRSRTFRVTARAASVSSVRRATNRVRVTGANVAARVARARVQIRPAQGPSGGVTG